MGYRNPKDFFPLYACFWFLLASDLKGHSFSCLFICPKLYPKPPKVQNFSHNTQKCEDLFSFFCNRHYSLQVRNTWANLSPLPSWALFVSKQARQFYFARGYELGSEGDYSMGRIFTNSPAARWPELGGRNRLHWQSHWGHIAALRSFQRNKPQTWEGKAQNKTRNKLHIHPAAKSKL